METNRVHDETQSIRVVAVQITVFYAALLTVGAMIHLKEENDK